MQLDPRRIDPQLVLDHLTALMREFHLEDNAPILMGKVMSWLIENTIKAYVRARLRSYAIALVIRARSIWPGNESRAASLLRLTYRAPYALLRMAATAVFFALEASLFLATAICAGPLVMLGFTIAAAVRSDKIDYSSLRGKVFYGENSVKKTAEVLGLSFTANVVVEPQTNPLIHPTVALLNIGRLLVYAALFIPRMIGIALKMARYEDLALVSKAAATNSAVTLTALANTVLWPLMAIYGIGQWIVALAKTPQAPLPRLADIQQAFQTQTPGQAPHHHRAGAPPIHEQAPIIAGAELRETIDQLRRLQPGARGPLG